MKKIVIAVIVLFALFEVYDIYDIWNTEIKPWKYIIQSWDTTAFLPSRFDFSVSSFNYKIWLRFFAKSIKLKAWTYAVDKTTTLNGLISNGLNKPTSEDREITILPWWNIFDVDAYLAKNWIINPWELKGIWKDVINSLSAKYSFLKWVDSLEGFLYPDTYRISLKADLNSVLTILLDTFDERVYSQLKWESKDFYSDVIMASIVEREEKSPENKKVVAGILKKRLAEKIAIWADATVCYAYDLTQQDCTPAFIGEVIYKKSPYNTRNMLWLPPTPISNPSLDTIKSTIFSVDSPYYYYLHDDSWNIHYAKTLQEHSRNKELYIK